MDFRSQDSENTSVPEIGNSPRVNRAQRTHRELWRGFPNSHKIDDKHVHERWKKIVMLMRSDGLISSSTHCRDVNLINLAADARKAIRDGVRYSAPNEKPHLMPGSKGAIRGRQKTG